MSEFQHVEDHCRRILRRSRESYENETPEPPRIEDLELWDACGVDYMAVRAEVDVEVPCGSCGQLAEGDPGAHLMGCQAVNADA